MNARAFQAWTGRLALLALLLLVAVPTASRFVHAAHGTAHVHALASTTAHGHAHGALPVEGLRPDGRAPLRPAPGDADCDYCPLLSALLAPIALPFPAHIPPRLYAAIPWPASPRLPWLHPSGLGSRGPPLHG